MILRWESRWVNETREKEEGRTLKVGRALSAPLRRKRVWKWLRGLKLQVLQRKYPRDKKGERYDATPVPLRRSRVRKWLRGLKLPVLQREYPRDRESDGRSAEVVGRR